MKNSLLTYCLFSLIICCSCQNNSDENKAVVTVFCGAGLADVITELRDSFEVNNPVDIKINFASSGTLARQLASGNKADIYISASQHWADYADSLDLFAERKPLYQNRLVFVTPVNSLLDSIEFMNPGIPEFDGRLSIGDPEHVPAGQYAKEALMHLGWWDKLKDRTLPAKDVRSALMPVELGECKLGIVYYSDAIASKKVRIAGIFPEGTYSPVIFHALLSKKTSRKSVEFYQMLNNNNFEEIWIKYGFSSVTEN